MHCLLATTLLLATTTQSQPAFRTVEFPSLDGLEVTADLYMPQPDKKTPFIVLCHQAGWSRGEYREIAPRLNRLGFNCLAIDQRSGKTINKVANETARRATAAKKNAVFSDAEQDMIAALRLVRKNYASGKILLWGSSYSAGLALRVAGENPHLLDGVLAFSPGEYFTGSGKPRDWVTTSAKKITCPTFVTSAQDEHKYWDGIFAYVPAKAKTKFVPTTKGNHGSRALWSRWTDHKRYWDAVAPFLSQFTASSAIPNKMSSDRVTSRARVPAKRVFRRPSAQQIRQMLSPIQYKVTQQDGTENAFQNEYWNNKRSGIYVDVVTGEPLFSSKDKYKSGTGWPSFFRPLVPANITSRTDYKLGTPRTEIRSKYGNSHLGHLFRDGPQPTGLRYCINSAALRFVPADRLEAEGYADFIGR